MAIEDMKGTVSTRPKLTMTGMMNEKPKHRSTRYV